MKVSDFDFALPPEAIAQQPVAPRDAARLLHVGGPGGDMLADHRVSDLPRLLRCGDLLVLNDTKVIPGRLRVRRGDASIEITLLREIAPGRWEALARRARRLRAGDRIVIADDFSALVDGKDGGQVTLAFDRTGASLMAALERYGAAPLPPYIKRPGPGGGRDREDYQTVYAARPGAVAAPTAGLHFTEHLLATLEDRGVRRAAVTLHVGAGTFLPVKTETLGDHVMHAEWGEIGADAVRAIARTRAEGGRVVAVGTTSLRLLESAVAADGTVRPFTGLTDIFITPGFRFRVADLLMTNFHLPRSTLFMLVCAFAGVGRMAHAYRHAIADGYRFYSYGDCCLLHRDDEESGGTDSGDWDGDGEGTGDETGDSRQA